MVKQLSIKRPKYEKPNKRTDDDDAVCDAAANEETQILIPPLSGANISDVERELYFLFCRFLQNSGHFCEQTAHAFIAEAAAKQLLPVHSTWTGQLRSMNYEEACKAYSHLPPNYIIQILRRSVEVINDVYPLDGGCSTSLLTDGRRSLLRNEENCLNISSKRRLRLIAPAYDAKPRAALVKEPLNFLLTELQRESRTASLALQTRYSARKFAGDFRLLKTIYSHLAPVFCTAYDATGRCFFSASDDRLIKVHDSRNGRLLTTLRGHPKEIGDISVDNENRLLVSGCTGNTSRVWRLTDGKPVASFRTHTHTVSAVKFLPLTFDKRRRFFVSAGLDGNLVLFEYDRVDLKFDAVEPRYLVDYRGRNSGTTQFGIVCFSFSKGGLFLACGSNDHYLRVFRLLTLKTSRSQHGKLDLCVEEDYSKKAHTDRVDSIVFANKSTRFVSGSRDGKGLIWRREAEGWQSIEINCSTAWCDPASDPQADRKARIGMVAWSCDDRLVFTSSSKNSVHCVKVWNSLNGAILHDLFGHYSDIFVLAAHPWQSDILLTSSHDGQAVLWNPSTGEKLWSWQNIIPNCGQEDIALLDAAFNPEGDQALITDYYGNVHIFGITSGSAYRNVPEQQFFHTDYHPIDTVGERVVDRNTQLDAYRMQPPLLVHADGDPYDWHLQRLVPGRETITYEQTRSIRTQIQQQYIHNALAMQLGADALGGAAAVVVPPAVQPPGTNVANEPEVAAVAMMGYAEAMAATHEPAAAPLAGSSSTLATRLDVSAGSTSTGGSTSITVAAGGATSSRSVDVLVMQPPPSQQFDVTKAYEGERRFVEPFDAATETRILDEKQAVTHRELEQYLLLKDRLHRHKRLAKLVAGGAGATATSANTAASVKKEDVAALADVQAAHAVARNMLRDARRNGQVMRLRSHQQQPDGGLRDGRSRIGPARDSSVPDGPLSLHLLRQLMRRRTHPNARGTADAVNRPTNNDTHEIPTATTSRSGPSRRRRQRGEAVVAREENGGNSTQPPPSRQGQVIEEHDSDADPDWEARASDEEEDNARLRRRRHRSGSGSSIEYIDERSGVRPLRPAHPDRSFETSSSSDDDAGVLSETEEEDTQAVSGSENDDGLYRDDEGFTIEEHQLERFGSRRRRKRALDEAHARRINNQNMPTTSQGADQLAAASSSGRPVRASRGRRRGQSSEDEELPDDEDAADDDDENRRRSTRLRERSQRGQRLRWFEDDAYSGGEEFQSRSRNLQSAAPVSSSSRPRRRARIADEEAEEISAMEVDEENGENRLRPSRRPQRRVANDVPNRSRPRALTAEERRTAAALRKLADSETSREHSPAADTMQLEDVDVKVISNENTSAADAALRNWLALPVGIGRNAEQDYYTEKHPNAWICQFKARRSPYFPQINDVVCYYKKAHAKFVEFVRENGVMELSQRQRDIANRLGDIDFLRVVDVSFVFMDSSWPELEPYRSAPGGGMQLVVAKIKLCRESVESHLTTNESEKVQAAPLAEAESMSTNTLKDAETVDAFRRALFGTKEEAVNDPNVSDIDRARDAVAFRLAADAVMGAFSDLRQELHEDAALRSSVQMPHSQSSTVDSTQHGNIAEDSDSEDIDDVVPTSTVTTTEIFSQRRPLKRKARGGRRAAPGRKRVKRKPNVDIAGGTSSTSPQPTDPQFAANAVAKPSRISSAGAGTLTPTGFGAVGEEFEIMYVDLLNVDPFLVLLSDVREACQIKWRPNDLCCAVLDVRRWYGHVAAVKPYGDWHNSANAYGAISVQWKQPANPAELIELFSPWDLLPAPPGTNLSTVEDGVKLSRDDYIDLGERYDTAPEIRRQWPAGDRVRTLWLINQYVNYIRNNELFKLFARPVDVKKYTDYLPEIPYPTDLWKICTRANYLFYRTVDAVQYDVTCISRNCNKFNASGRVICKQADVLTEVLTRMLGSVRELQIIPENPDYQWIDRMCDEVIEQMGGPEWLDTDDPVEDLMATSLNIRVPARRLPASSSSRNAAQPSQRTTTTTNADDFIVPGDATDDHDEEGRYPKRQTRGKLPPKYQNDIVDYPEESGDVGMGNNLRRKSHRVAEQQQPIPIVTSSGRRVTAPDRGCNLFAHGLQLQRGDFRPDAIRSSRTNNADRTPQKQRPNVRQFAAVQQPQQSTNQEASSYAEDLNYEGLARRSVRIVARSLAAVDAGEHQSQPQGHEEVSRAARGNAARRPAALYAEYDQMAGVASTSNVVATSSSNGRRQSFRSSPRRAIYDNRVNYAESGATSDDYDALANLSGTDIEDDEATDDGQTSEETFDRSTTSNGDRKAAQIKMRFTRRQAKHNTRGASSAYVIAEVQEEEYEEESSAANASMQQVDEDYAVTDTTPPLVAEQQNQLSSETNSTLIGGDEPPPTLSMQCVDVKLEESGNASNMLASSSSSAAVSLMPVADAAIAENMDAMLNGTEPALALENGFAHSSFQQHYPAIDAGSHSGMMMNGTHSNPVRRGGGRRRVKIEEDDETLAAISNASTPVSGQPTSVRKSSRAPIPKERSDFIYSGALKKNRLKDEDFKLEDEELAEVVDGLETDYDDDQTDSGEQDSDDEDITPASSRGGSTYGKSSRRKKKPTQQRKIIAKKRSSLKSKTKKPKPSARKRSPAAKRKPNGRSGSARRRLVNADADDDDDADEDYDADVANMPSHSQRRSTRAVARRKSYNIDKDFGSGDEC